MYRHALGKAEQLGLNKIELYETRFSMNDKLYLALIGAFSVFLSLLSVIFNYPIGAALAGWAYHLIWIISIVRAKKRRNQLNILMAEE